MSAAGAKPKILFVDDEKRVLNSMRALFRRDYELHLTTLGSEAIRIAEEHAVDVIIADQRMPEMSGVEVLGAVKERSPATVRILLTGYADLDAIEGSINIGEVFRFLSKPCPPQELRETLAEAVQAARQSAPAAEAIARAGATTDESPAPAAAAGEKSAAPQTAAQIAPEPPASRGEESPRPVPDPPAAAREPTPAAKQPVSDKPKPVARSKPKPKPKPEPKPERLSASDRALGESFEDHVATVPNLALELDREFAEGGGTMETEIIMSGDSNVEFVNTIVIEDGVRTTTRSAAREDMDRVGVALFTSDDEFADSVERVLQGRYAIARASTLVEVTELLGESRAGVLVTDFCADGAMLRNMISTLKRYLPELITIVVSIERDAAEMISLINHGQVFRYMSKPMDESRLVQNVNAAVLRHIQLRQNPELVQRHSVIPDRPPRQGAAILAQFVGRIKEMRKFWVRT